MMNKAVMQAVHLQEIRRNRDTRTNDRRRANGNMRGSLLCLALLVLTALAPAAAAGLKLIQLEHRSWTAQDGAPLDIGSLAQGKDGTLWIGSAGGLVNFDGLRFVPFNFEPGAVKFPTAGIKSVFVSRGGVVWAGFSLSGIAEIGAHGSVRAHSEKNGLPVGEVRQILEAPDGTMLAIARNRLVRLQGGRWGAVADAAASLKNENVVRMFFDRRRTLWVATETSVWSLEDGQAHFQKTEEPGGFVTGFAESPDGHLWMSAITGDSRTRRLRVGIDHGAPSQPLPFAADGIDVDRDGRLWLASQNGLVLLPASAPDGKNAETFSHVDGLSDDSATSNILRDMLGNVWVGTPRGLDRFRAPRLVRFIDRPIPRMSLLAACPSGEMWLGGYYGMVSARNGTITQSRRKDADVNDFSAFCDRHSVLWLTDEDGLWRLDHGVYQRMPAPPDLPVSWIRQIVGEDEGLLYASITRDGLWKFSHGQWSHVVLPGIAETAPPYALLWDSRQRLWIGGIDNTVTVLDGERVRAYSAGDTHPLGVIEVFHESAYGMLAGGTGGIAVFRNGHFVPLPIRSAVPVSGISGLVESRDGDLWLNGLHGVFRVPAAEIKAALADPAYSMTVESFADSGIAGPASQGLRLPSAVADMDGRLWFATSNTVVSIDPAARPSTAATPLLGPISAAVDNMPLASGATIAPGPHTIRIRYTGVYLTAPESVVYRYRLDGVDRDWQSVGGRYEAVYTSLAPGSYAFHLSASNGNGVWAPQDGTLRFTVLPAFYQTVWFWAACALVALLICRAVVLLRVRRSAEAMRKRLAARFDERVKLARDLHDTLLQGVQSLLLTVHVSAQGLAAGSRSRVNLEKAVDVAERVLMEGRDRVSGLRSGQLMQTDLSKAIKAVGDELNADGAVKLTVRIDGNAMALREEVWEELYLIGREMLNNAFRHAAASRIGFTLTYRHQFFRIDCSDDGRGFDPDRYLRIETRSEAGRGRHWGLKGIGERAQQIGGTVECASSAAGTTIAITVPGKRAYRYRAGMLGRLASLWQGAV
jgi:signal transduction histidine kinase/ligand-binding sensor domain-containing protein